MTTIERALKYADSVPAAIEGQQGSVPTFSLACTLVHGFCLGEHEVWAVMNHYNAKCQPPWPDDQMAHKIADAFAAKSDKPAGYLLDAPGKVQRPNGASHPAPKRILVDPAPRIQKFLAGFRCADADLSDASPIKLGDDWRQDGALLVSHLFQPGEKINVVTDFKLSHPKEGPPKANPDGWGITADRDTLISYWKAKGIPKSDAGGWMRINPMDGKGPFDPNVTAFRHALIEFDRIPIELQISLLAKVPLPISAILTSGGKSVHAWVRVDCANFDEYKQDVEAMREMMTRYGIDRVNKNPSRLSRLVGAQRVIGAAGDGSQRLIYLSPNPMQKPIL